MPKQPTLAADMKFLATLVFQKSEELRPLMTDIHSILRDKKKKEFHVNLELLRRWLRTPYTLWLIDFKGFGHHVCKQIKSGRPLDEITVAILGHLEELPAELAQQLIAEREACVRLGNYDPYLTEHAKAKYIGYEKELLANPAFRKDWEGFLSRHDISSAVDYKGVLRRTMCQERNFRSATWLFNWDTPRGRMQAEFDCLCGRYCLYGVQKGVPLLQKLSVNATPFGLILFMPRFWSFDEKRDLQWREIKCLLKAWGVQRLGEKRSLGRAQRQELAKAAYLADKQARKDGYTGKKRAEFVAQFIGWSPDADPANVRKLVAEGEELVEGEKRGKKAARLKS